MNSFKNKIFKIFLKIKMIKFLFIKKVPVIIIAHEFFDALPINIFEYS